MPATNLSTMQYMASNPEENKQRLNPNHTAELSLHLFTDLDRLQSKGRFFGVCFLFRIFFHVILCLGSLKSSCSKCIFKEKEMRRRYPWTTCCRWQPPDGTDGWCCMNHALCSQCPALLQLCELKLLQLQPRAKPHTDLKKKERTSLSFS